MAINALKSAFKCLENDRYIKETTYKNNNGKDTPDCMHKR